MLRDDLDWLDLDLARWATAPIPGGRHDTGPPPSPAQCVCEDGDGPCAVERRAVVPGEPRC